MLDQKQNVFDDFIAAAEWLIKEGYTKPEKLSIEGGSNGGLLTGAAITQRPELFRAALVLVPLLDMLRYQDFLMARYWCEYGSAEDPAVQVLVDIAVSACEGGDEISRGATAGEHDSRTARTRCRALQRSPSIRPSGRCCCGSIAKPVTVRASRSTCDCGSGGSSDLQMWQLGMLK
jgi:poly(3-hydroxybutyrate) depolymerase